MIEQGLVELVQGNAGVSAIAAAGGYFAILPKDATLPSWTYTFIFNSSGLTLTTPESQTPSRVQIDCYGSAAADAIRLAKAIDSVLSGYRGTLADPDSIFVQGCFQINSIDFFDDARRTYRRMLEYRLWYNA